MVNMEEKRKLLKKKKYYREREKERNDVVRKNRIEEKARSRRVEDQVC